MKLSEKERKAFNRYVDDLHYQASMFESSYGIGKMKGIKEGKKRSEERSRKEERLHLAANLLDVLDDATIAKKTGLTLEDVQELRRIDNPT